MKIGEFLLALFQLVTALMVIGLILWFFAEIWPLILIALGLLRALFFH